MTAQNDSTGEPPTANGRVVITDPNSKGVPYGAKTGKIPKPGSGERTIGAIPVAAPQHAGPAPTADASTSTTETLPEMRAAEEPLSGDTGTSVDKPAPQLSDPHLQELYQRVAQLEQRPVYSPFAGAFIGLATLAAAAFLTVVGINDLKRLDQRVTTETAAVGKALETKVDTQYTAIGTTLTALADRDTMIGASLTALAREDGAIGATLTAYAERLDGVERARNTDAEAIKGITTNYDALKAAVDTLGPRIGELENKYGPTSASVTALTERVSGIEEARVAEAKQRADEIAALRTDYGALQERYNAMQRLVDEFTSPTATAEMKRTYDARLEEAVKKMKSTAATGIKKEADALRERLMKLEARVQKGEYNTLPSSTPPASDGTSTVTPTPQYTQPPSEAGNNGSRRYTVSGLVKEREAARAATRTATIVNPPSLYDRIVMSPQLSADDARLVREAVNYSDKMLGIEWELRNRWLDVEKLAVEGRRDELQGLIGGFEKDAPQFAEKLAARTRHLLNNFYESQKKAPSSPK